MIICAVCSYYLHRVPPIASIAQGIISTKTIANGHSKVNWYVAVPPELAFSLCEGGVVVRLPAVVVLLLTQEVGCSSLLQPVGHANDTESAVTDSAVGVSITDDSHKSICTFSEVSGFV